MSNARFSIIQAKAVRDRRVSDSVLRTLNALGLYSDENGWCFPKQNTLADDTGKSRQTVNEHIGQLKEFGYLEVVAQFRPDGSQTANKYRLLFDAPLSSLDFTPPVNPEVDSNNDPSNDPYNTGDGLSSLPVEWQVAAGAKRITVHDEKEAQMKDSANLIAQGTGALHNAVFLLAYTFMTTRGIIIPLQDAKGNRKAAKAMVSQGVLPHHVESAVKYMIQKNWTCVDLFSVQKIATNEANPAPESYDGAIEGI